PSRDVRPPRPNPLPRKAGGEGERRSLAHPRTFARRHEVVMALNAYSRARALLRYARPAQWTAIVAGVVTAILYATLVLLLALFTDLLVTRGRIPNFAQLSLKEQETAVKDWKEIPREDRERALQHVGFSDFQSPPEKIEAAPLDVQARWRHYQNLVGDEATEYPPVLGKAEADDLRAWASKRRTGGDPYLQAAVEHEWRWRAYVWYYLDRRVGPEAAAKWQPDSDTFIAPGLGEDNRRASGFSARGARARQTPWARPTALFAPPAGWTGHGEDANRPSLTGLLLIGLILVSLRGLGLILMNDAAARAALEVVTRLRRSIYHHTARQGNMTISPEAVDEAGGLFSRQGAGVP